MAMHNDLPTKNARSKVRAFFVVNVGKASPTPLYYEINYKNAVKSSI
jgi:hypothetical protein